MTLGWVSGKSNGNDDDNRRFPCVNRGLQIPLSHSGQTSEGVERGTVGIRSD